MFNSRGFFLSVVRFTRRYVDRSAFKRLVYGFVRDATDFEGFKFTSFDGGCFRQTQGASTDLLRRLKQSAAHQKSQLQQSHSDESETKQKMAGNQELELVVFSFLILVLTIIYFSSDFCPGCATRWI